MTFTVYQLGLILYATVITFARIWLIILASVIISIFLGILSARVRAAELIVIPVVDVLESVPVVSFFPVILVLLLTHVGGTLGVELSVDLLLMTAVIWNIILGVYEAVALIPKEYLEVSKVFHFTLWQRLWKLYIPASYSKIMTNITPSFASALFYITFSEVISVGVKQYSVFGIATLAIDYSARGEFLNLIILFVVLTFSIYLTFRLIINPLVGRGERYRFEVVSETATRRRRRLAAGPVAESIAARASQIADSGRRMISRVGSVLTFPVTRRETKRRLSVSQKQTNVIVGTILLVVFALGVYVIAASGFYSAFFKVFLTSGFLTSATKGLLYDLLRIGLVYGATLLTMIPLAIYLGSRPNKGKNASMAMQMLYSTPSPLFLPALLVVLVPVLSPAFGLYSSINLVVLIITYLSAGQYIFFNAFGAMLSLPSEMKMTAESFSFSPWKKLRYMILPALFPSMVTGSMVSIGSYWGGLAVSEYAVVGGTVFQVSNGLMLQLDEYIRDGSTLYADAIDIYMVIFIIVLSFLLWIRLYAFAKRRYSYDV